MQDIIKEILSKKIFAVVGSFRNEQKVAYQILKNLKSRGYEVYPVNPKTTEVDGEKCYSSLADLPQKPDVVDIVTPPEISLEIARQCKQLGIEYIWLQPGAEDQKVIDFCKENNIKCVYKTCIMLQR